MTRFYSIHRRSPDGTYDPMPTSAVAIDSRTHRVVHYVDDMVDTAEEGSTRADALARRVIPGGVEACEIDYRAFLAHVDQWRRDRPPLVEVPGF